MKDFKKWEREGFGKPDFGASLALFNPQGKRKDSLEYFALFPMYTPNASKDTRFEALILRVPWPGWLQDIESALYQNNKFVPANIVDCTQGL